ncbi:hypothetical protein COOONC_00720 [Cooperia oncophora]
MNELDEMQNEKRKQLLEKERNTMQEHEKKYYNMREQWQTDLAPRKLFSSSPLLFNFVSLFVCLHHILQS